MGEREALMKRFAATITVCSLAESNRGYTSTISAPYDLYQLVSGKVRSAFEATEEGGESRVVQPPLSGALFPVQALDSGHQCQ